MKRTITLTVEQAKELYEQDNSFRTTILSEFTDVELGIKKELKRWEELGVFDGFYIDSACCIEETLENSPTYDMRDIFATEKQAMSALAMAQLSQLMADLGDECDVDWSSNSTKYILNRSNKTIDSNYTYHEYYFLAFKTESVRDAFLEKHEELIKQYFMI